MILAITLALAQLASWTDDPLDTVLVGARIVGTGTAKREGEQANIRLVDDRIASADYELSAHPEMVFDFGGKWIAPAFIDSHVHFVLLDQKETMRKAGIAGFVDLAAPLARVGELWMPFPHYAFAGPMLTAPGGYPLDSWGADGYGRAVASASEARALVAELAAAKATILKIPFGHPPELDDATVSAAIEAAHARKMKVVAHALSDAAASRAARLGADILAHTTVEPLKDETIALWSKRIVISTLAAFGGSASAVDNLRRLRAAGATVLYGTDFGNTSDPSIQAAELALMQRAGMSGADILEAGTRAPAKFWGFDDLGSVAPKKSACLLVLDADPRVDPTTLSRPTAVYMNGYRQ